MLNPFTCKIVGELSRADAVTLVHACRGKHVVEFGVGASTNLISQCAKSLTSFDTEQSWINKVHKRLSRTEKTCKPDLILISKKIDQILPKIKCDIMFNDGLVALRVEFLRQYWIDCVKEKMIIHDGRKPCADWYDKTNGRMVYTR